MLIGVLLCSFFAIPLVLILLVRFFKRPTAAFHRAFTNRLASKFAARLPGFAVLVNVGRRSGKIYRTPVNVFWNEDVVLIALTYGRKSGWVSNVLAAGHCELQTRGVSYQLFSPVVVHDPLRGRFPRLVSTVLGLIDANDYVQFEVRYDEARRTRS